MFVFKSSIYRQLTSRSATVLGRTSATQWHLGPSPAGPCKYLILFMFKVEEKASLCSPVKSVDGVGET